MSREDYVRLAGRALGFFVLLWFLTELTYLPEYALSFLHYLAIAQLSTADSQSYYSYERSLHLFTFGFLVTRIIGLAYLSWWLFRGGAEVVNLLLPEEVTRERSSALQ